MHQALTPKNQQYVTSGTYFYGHFRTGYIDRRSVDGVNS